MSEDKKNKNTQTVALVPLRGGSKSIPKKNIKEICGKPLCEWVIQAAVGSNAIDKVYVSTDSTEIRDVVENLGLGVIVIERPVEYASDEATTEAVMLHFMAQVDFSKIVTIQATSPLLTALDLDTALIQFEQEKLDSMVTAVRTKRFYWNDDGTPINYDPLYRPRRQDFKGTLMENGAFYVTTRDVLTKHHCRLGGKVGVFEMSESTAYEIDEPSDWAIVSKQLVSR